MSHSKPNIDTSYFNDFLFTKGKKKLNNEEFQKAKLYRIANQIVKVDWIQGNLAKASIEIYFHHKETAIEIIKDVLIKSNYQSLISWDMLIDAYMQFGDMENTLATFLEMVQLEVEISDRRKDTLLHVIKIYLIDNLMKVASILSAMKNERDSIISSIKNLNEAGISLDIYRKFISNIYNVFYSCCSGTVEPNLFFNDLELVIRVNTSIDDAEELFNLNNLYRDSIMQWYENADMDEQIQIEKVTVYFKSKVFKDDSFEVFL